jgi:hypothetical protein
LERCVRTTTEEGAEEDTASCWPGEGRTLSGTEALAEEYVDGSVVVVASDRCGIEAVLRDAE